MPTNVPPRPSPASVIAPADICPPAVTVQLLPTRIPEIQRDPLRFLMTNAAAHGDFIHYPLRLWEVYQATHPAVVKHVLQDNNRNYSKNTIQYNTLAQVTGRGLLTSDGAHWLRQRRLMQPAFHRKRIHAFGDVVVAATTDMLDRWAARPDGAELDVDAEMMQVALEIVGKTLFNLDLRREAPEMTEGVLEMLAYVVYRAKAMVAPPIAWPTARNRRYRAAMAKLEGVIYDTIAARRAGADGQGDGGSGDVLSMLLAARDEETGEGMTDAQIRDEMATLIIAGHETVASALTSAWFLLSRNPAARETLEAELDGALGGRPPTADDLPALPYTRMVFEETLRLYPPAWLITRRALAEDRIGDTVIPANALLIMSPYVTHRLPSFWPDPLRFEPRRFAPEAAADRPRFAYIPFGGGPRLCVGDSFALMEGPLILAATAQRFRLDLDPDREVVLDALVTLRPRGGLHMSALKRD